MLTAIVVLGIVSCSKSMSRYDEEIDRAQQTMRSNTDSALSILDAIDPFELKIDSLRAKYHFLKGYGHLKRNRSMIGAYKLRPRVLSGERRCERHQERYGLCLV